MEYEVNEPAVKYQRMSPQEFLAFERASEERHEYFEGEVITMQGASLRHEDIVGNLLREIGYLLKGKDCRIRPSNLRTASKNFKSFMYPDATIVCGKPMLSDDSFDVLQNPTVIFEVVSKTSESNDYIKKFLYYKQIDSLQEYVLINSFEKIHIDIYRRNNVNMWNMQTYTSLSDTLELPSIGIAISLADIYDNVIFESIIKEE